MGEGITSLRPRGERLGSVSGANTTRFLYDGSDLVGEYDGSNAMLARYVHGVGGGDDPVLAYDGAGTADSALRQLYADRLGSIALTTGYTGTLTGRGAYDEWGLPGAANAGVGAGAKGRFGYTGQAWLPELGMSYYKARMYSPVLGRFMQTDPIGYGDGMNMYRYVGNNPINGVDPTGLADQAGGNSNLCNIDPANPLCKTQDYCKITGSLIQRPCDDSNSAGGWLYGGAVGGYSSTPSLWGGGGGGGGFGFGLVLTAGYYTGGKPTSYSGDGWVVTGNRWIPGYITYNSFGASAGGPGSADAAETASNASDLAKLQMRTVRNMGLNGEEVARRSLIASGFRILGSQVYVRDKQGRLRIIDFVVRGGAQGILGVEVKYGNTTRNARQLAVDASIATNGGTVVSRNQPNFDYGSPIKFTTMEMPIRLNN